MRPNQRENLLGNFSMYMMINSMYMGINSMDVVINKSRTVIVEDMVTK